MTHQPQTIEEFYTRAQSYVELFDAFVRKHALMDRVRADHICFKCDSKESYEKTRALFEEESAYLYQSIISMRRIAIIKLKRPIETRLGPIWFVELSDQKPDGSQVNAYDHIEAYATAGTYEDMVQRFEAVETVTKIVRPHHTTHDIDIGRGFLFRCTQGLLIKKIKSSEML